MSRQTASISIDLDNLWSYLKTHGDEQWASYPSYLDLVVPRMLDSLQQQKQLATFFIVGQDAADEKNRQAIRSIADAGHEIGNHSFRHEPWLHLYSREEIEDELTSADKILAEVTGKKPIGFRGPGFSYSADVLEVLAELEYRYDASTFPTFLGPVARAYYFFKSRLSKEQKKERKQLFGKLTNGFRSNKPYFWELDSDRRLLEIPVTTMPIFRLPIHMSYLLYLASYSRPLASLYFWIALTLCRLTRTAPSMLLHPLDFMDAEDEPRLAFFPGMKLAKDKKIEFIVKSLNAIRSRFELVPMMSQATQCGARRLTVKNIEFARVASPSS